MSGPNEFLDGASDGTQSDMRTKVERNELGDFGEVLPQNSSESRWSPATQRFCWIAFVAVSFIFFTIIKFPEDKIKAYIQGVLTSQLSPLGFSIQATKSSLSFWLGVSYRLKDVTVTYLNSSLQVEEISLSPSLFSFVFGKLGGSYSLKIGRGNISGSFNLKKKDLTLGFYAKEIDFQKHRILQFLEIPGGFVLSGTGNFSGDVSQLEKSKGSVQLDISKISLESISIPIDVLMKLNLPSLNVSKADVDLRFQNGKLQIKTFQLGKPGNVTDDIILNLTGDLTIDRNLSNSRIQSKMDLKLSQKVLASLSLATFWLNPGKQADGSYICYLEGSFSSLIPCGTGLGTKK